MFSTPSYFPNTNPYTTTPSGGGLFNSLLGGLLGTNPDGSVRPLNLGSVITLPTVTVAADSTQKNQLLLIAGLSAAAYFIFKKKWYKKF